MFTSASSVRGTTLRDVECVKDGNVNRIRAAIEVEPEDTVVELQNWSWLVEPLENWRRCHSGEGDKLAEC